MLNIEKSAFKKGQYVGYGCGKVWTITNHGRYWMAQSGTQWIQAPLLRDISKQIEIPLA